MLKSRTLAVVVAGLATTVSLLVVLERGGAIAWVGFCSGTMLLAKIGWWPSKRDLSWGVGLILFAVLMWVATLYYVISTYESGEVVELVVDTSSGARTVRLWVLEIGTDPLVYYDAEPEVAKSLIAGKPLQFTRGHSVSTRIPRVTLVESLQESEANRILGVMEAKYGQRMTAASVFYVMLGSPRDRVALVAELPEE